MAANKFATMLHRNTNKLTLILVYAILEWILIMFLLLNSLFSYLIIKFADYFGLKRPCLWCSRLDHIFDHTKNKNFYRDLVCDTHASEISKLGYCLNHKKLAQSKDMCEDCSSSSRPDKNEIFTIKMIQSDGEKGIENAEENLRCSCCEVQIDNKFYSPYLLIKPSWGVLDCIQKGNLIEEIREDDEVANIQLHSDVGEAASDQELEAGEEEKVDAVTETEEGWANFPSELIRDLSSDENTVQVPITRDASVEIVPNLLDNYEDYDHHSLIPVELIDSTTTKIQKGYKSIEEVLNHQETDFDFEIDLNTNAELVMENRCSVEGAAHEENKEESKYALLENMEIGENEDYPILYTEEGDLVMEVCGKIASIRATRTPSEENEEEEEESHVQPASEEVPSMQTNETERDMVMETEMLDEELTTEDPTEAISSLPSCTHENPTETISSLPPCILEDPTEAISSLPPCTHEDISISSNKLHEENDQGFELAEVNLVECKTMSIKQVTDNHLPVCLEFNENEDEKIPETPTSIEGLDHLHKNLLLLEKKESGTEESLDGSVISEFEIGEGVLNIEKLKTVLRTERKALNALYAELEEERSASAVAANQTMAMINRLQEEKAAMQMEALQYQRMMEEQTEYDQEALELMNELVVKREKEKQELEKELEVYRKKVMDYEAKEKFMSMRRRKEESMRSGNSSFSCSNTEDSDGISIDLNHEVKENDGLYSNEENGHHNTPVDDVLNLDESLAHFEEEKLSILEQLKVLEEKLFTLDEGEEQHITEIKPNKHFYEENGNEFHENSHYSSEANEMGNGYSKEMNGNHHQERRLIGAKAKRLLPLFDAIGEETEDGELNGHDLIPHNNSLVSYPGQDYKKLAIEEEIDHVYERLRALEADREFLRHCISSLNKGDKGLDLLQEILQHLRDLRSVDLQSRNMGDGIFL